jgi:hypothetical protein
LAEKSWNSSATNADKERWLRIMMTEELGLPPEAPRVASWAALVYRSHGIAREWLSGGEGA